MMRASISTSCALAAALTAACSGPPCRTQTDCDFGEYCFLSVSGPGDLPNGECRKDCEQNSDCPQPATNISYAICSNEGRCETLDRPPKLRILEPEEQSHFPEGTERVRVSGEVKIAGPTVVVSARAKNANGCGGGIDRTVELMNPTPGSFATLSFILEGIELDPGESSLLVEARTGGADKKTSVDVIVDCPGCATIAIHEPKPLASAPGLELPALAGSIMPLTVKRGIWRIFSADGDVLDGTLPVSGGAFAMDRLPLFPGLNHVEVLVTGVGTGLGEARCSSLVSSGTARESGLRLVLIGDDPDADLDTHLIGPTGHFGDPMTSLSPRSQNPSFGGTVIDDVDGPEVTTVPMPPDGVYGVIVEPVIDGRLDGSNALMHVLFDGRLATPRPIGPRHLTSLDGKLWIVGTVKIAQGTVEWTTIDEVVEAAMVPVDVPSAWTPH
jgi:hypothetical protein